MSMNEKEFLEMRNEDLVTNPNTRVAVALCLDNSGSMGGEPIEELNNGIKLFYEAILADEVARYAVEICIVSFDYEAVLVQDFCSIERQEIPVLSTRRGTTHIGEGVNYALDMLERRKKEYQDKGVDYFQPWLVLMTDGKPEGESSDVTQVAMDRTAKMVNDNKLTVFPIGIGPYADKDILQKFSPKRAPLKLKGLHFNEFFEWLSKSVGKVSSSIPGDQISLPKPDWFDPNWDHISV